MDSEITDIRSRIWSLIAVDELNKAGVQPSSRNEVHVCVYIANCLSELYTVQPFANWVIWQNDGPIYPNLQEGLDRLVALGIVNVDSFDFVGDRGVFPLGATYSISHRGAKVSDGLNSLVYGRELKNLMSDILGGLVRRWGLDQSMALRRDGNYGQPGLGAWSFIDFSDIEDNNSLEIAEYFEKVLGLQGRISERKKAFLYTRYLSDRGK